MKTYAAPLAATSIFGTELSLALAMCAGLAHSVGRSWCSVINSPSSGDHFRRCYQTAPWETCSDVAVFANYFGQTYYTCSRTSVLLY